MAQSFYPIKLFLKHRPIFVMTIINIVMNLLMWGWLIINIRPREEAIFLHYSVLFGIDLTGSWGAVYVVPAMGLCIFVVNTVIGWLLFEKDKVASYASVFSAVFVQVILGIVTSLLVFLNV